MQRTLPPGKLAMGVLLAVLPGKNQEEIHVRVAMPAQRNALVIYGFR